jgi:hypothetical protein
MPKPLSLTSEKYFLSDFGAIASRGIATCDGRMICSPWWRFSDEEAVFWIFFVVFFEEAFLGALVCFTFFETFTL